MAFRRMYSFFLLKTLDYKSWRGRDKTRVLGPPDSSPLEAYGMSAARSGSSPLRVLALYLSSARPSTYSRQRFRHPRQALVQKLYILRRNFLFSERAPVLKHLLAKFDRSSTADSAARLIVGQASVFSSLASTF